MTADGAPDTRDRLIEVAKGSLQRCAEFNAGVAFTVPAAAREDHLEAVAAAVVNKLLDSGEVIPTSPLLECYVCDLVGWRSAEARRALDGEEPDK